MKHMTLAAGLAVLTLGLSSPGAPAVAQSAAALHPVPQRILVPAAAAAAHRLFGFLKAASGPMLTIQLRNGRLVRVDATQAFALQHVSAPLYLNKPTVVDGTFAPSGTFVANVVKRGAPRPTSWGVDR